MAISLESISKPEIKPVVCTILGEAGVGKTTLAANFPKPIFIRAEDGLASLTGRDVDAFPLATGTVDIFDAITALGTQDHEFKTLVIDSVTRLNTMVESEVVNNDPKKPKSINQALGGYGAGHASVAEQHRKLRDWCGQLRDVKGMHIVFIAHADSETIELPDQDAYTRYTLRMNKRSVSAYVDDADVVAFIRLRTFTHGDGERKKAVSDGTRELICYPLAANVSKNRYGITQALEINENENPLTKFITSLQEK